MAMKQIAKKMFDERVDQIGMPMRGSGFTIDLDDTDFDEDQQFFEVTYKGKRVMAINLAALIDRRTR